jgi:anti-sigma factor RsiW
MNMLPLNGACEDYEFEVAELVDGTLAPEKARIVSLHIAGCARCRRWRDEYAAMDARLARTLPRPRLAPDFEWRLAARLRTRTADGRADTRAAAQQEYAELMAGLRERLRSRAAGSVAGAVATTGCVLAMMPVLLDHLPFTLDAQASSAVLQIVTAGVMVAALAWSFGNRVLPGLRFRG